MPTLALPQGSRYDSTAQKNVQNFVAPIPGGLITVCTSAGTGIPCSPVATIYSDQGLTQQITGSVITADSNGNFGFWAAPGTYTYSITATGVTGKLYTVTLPDNPSANTTYTGNKTFTQQIISTVATGTAPFSIASTTVTPNLNAQLHNGKTAPAGNIVGDTDTQTLTNKTLTTASSGNSVSLLNGQGNVGPITGNSAVQVVYTYTLPANTVGSLKALRINLSYQHAGSASVAFATTFNGITMQSWSSTAAQGLEHLTLINTGSASCAIEGFALVNTPAVAAAGAGNVASGLSWASGQVITFTFNVANTDTVTGMQFVVELIQ